MPLLSTPMTSGFHTSQPALYHTKDYTKILYHIKNVLKLEDTSSREYFVYHKI